MKTRENPQTRRRTRRAFLGLALSFLAGAAGWKWLLSSGEEDGVQWPLRKVLRFNDALWAKLQSPNRVAPLPPAPSPGSTPRFNGDIGIETEVDFNTWRLNVMRPNQTQAAPLQLTLAEIRAMPRTETTALFKCIEGWSDPISYAGVRFSEFLRYLNIKDPPLYVALQTPDQKYYVSIDLESMLHPQTVLTYEMNGAPLSSDDGAPLRLIIPIKYGIKSLKRIGSLSFSNSRPRDYWEEQGYDWFAGL
jgi:DMSO/TMAO reductase YedYZ molybdopterin-dependent catalytic subunit